MAYKKLLALAAICFMMITVYPVYASGQSISLDGEFGDWGDKPSVLDTAGDGVPMKDVVEVKWFPDPSNSNLYINARRSVYNDKKVDKDTIDDRDDEDYSKGKESDEDLYSEVMKNYLNGNIFAKYWYFAVDFSTGKTAHVFYHPPSRKVFVILVDGSNKYLWSANGKWGDDKNTAEQVEFYIPLKLLADSPESGYQVDFNIQSSQDRVPDSGSITVSTISTFPVVTMAGVAVTVVLIGILCIYRLKKNARTAFDTRNSEG